MDKDINIVIIELDFHNEVVNSLAIQLLSQSVTLHIACTVFIFDNLPSLQNNSKINWIIKEQQTTNSTFLNKVFSIKTVDAFLINGFGEIKKEYLNLCLPANCTYILHDLHSVFDPFGHLFISSHPILFLKDIIKLFKFIFTDQKNNNLRFISNMKQIALPSANTLKYYNDNNYYSKKAVVAKFAINEFSYTFNNASDKVSIVIPGTIIKKSRDYQSVVQAFRLKNNYNKKVQLVLLGRAVDAYGRRIIECLRELQNDHFELVSFDKFIPQSTFDKYMFAANFLLLPMQRYMKFQIFKEINSQSCVSGNINDMVRFAKPSIIPDFYKLDNDNLEALVSRYSTPDEMVNQIITFIETTVNGSKYSNINLKDQKPEKEGKLLIKNILSI